MYCVDLYSRFNKLEIDWEILLGKASDALPASRRFSTEGEIKNRLDHREIDSRVIFWGSVNYCRTPIVVIDDSLLILLEISEFLVHSGYKGVHRWLGALVVLREAGVRLVFLCGDFYCY